MEGDGPGLANSYSRTSQQDSLSTQLNSAAQSDTFCAALSARTHSAPAHLRGHGCYPEREQQ